MRKATNLVSLLAGGGKAGTPPLSNFASADGDSSGAGSRELAPSLEMAPTSGSSDGSCSSDGSGGSSSSSAQATLGEQQAVNAAAVHPAQRGAADGAGAVTETLAVHTSAAVNTSGGMADMTGNAADPRAAPTGVAAAAQQAAPGGDQPTAEGDIAAPARAAAAAPQAAAGGAAPHAQSSDCGTEAEGARPDAVDLAPSEWQNPAATASSGESVQRPAPLPDQSAQPPPEESSLNRLLSLRQRFSFSGPSHGQATSPAVSAAAAGAAIPQ